MSWLVIVINAHNAQESLRSDRINPTWLPEAMGSEEQVRQAIGEVLSGIEWSEKEGYFDSGSFRFRISFSLDVSSGLVNVVNLDIRGSGDPVTTILELCQHNHWVADDEDCERLTADASSQTGWKEWQAYRDRVIDSTF
ncbi:MAG: hypothetical protein F6K00_31975 [Leptolyngbya sp. SIOISBB]|nr:hypothetical protein [Leptolyngbya sp. SIOISBB]